MERVLNEGLMAIVPEYMDHRGNCTILYSKYHEPLIVEKNIQTVIKLIAKYFMIDLKEMKKRYGKVVSSPNLVPIPLSKKDIFIPIKTRIPMLKNDGAFSYVNMKYIEKVSKDKKNTMIHLEKDLKIQGLCGKATVDKHMKNGYVVSTCYEERNMKVAEEEVIYNGEKMVIKIFRE